MLDEKIFVRNFLIGWGWIFNDLRGLIPPFWVILREKYTNEIKK